MEALTCSLCGREDHDVRMALVAYADEIAAILGRLFDFVPRCTDRPDCRERVERSSAEPWPLRDPRPMAGAAR
jgi:hypothetical protein